MKTLEAISLVIYKLILQGFEVVGFEESIEAEANASFICNVQLQHEVLGDIQYKFKTYYLDEDFRDLMKLAPK